MAIAIAPNQIKWMEPPADFAAEVIELKENDPIVRALADMSEGERLYESGATLEDCANQAQRRAFRTAENYARNVWKYEAQAAFDSYAISNGATPFDLDAIHERLQR